MQRRKSARYQLRAPVVFKWIDCEGLVQQGRGFTHNISTAGVFVLCDVLPPMGSALVLEVLLPSLDVSLTGLRMKNEGKVARVEQKQTLRFAAAFDFPVNESDIQRA